MALNPLKLYEAVSLLADLRNPTLVKLSEIIIYDLDRLVLDRELLFILRYRRLNNRLHFP